MTKTTQFSAHDEGFTGQKFDFAPNYNGNHGQFPTQKYLRWLLDYSPARGRLRWRHKTDHQSGHWFASDKIRIGDKVFDARKIIARWMTGQVPSRVYLESNLPTKYAFANLRFAIIKGDKIVHYPEAYLEEVEQVILNHGEKACPCCGQPIRPEGKHNQEPVPASYKGDC